MKMLRMGIAGLLLAVIGCSSPTAESPSGGTKSSTFKLSKAELQDKIKGGWAGQVIGCSYGGPTEFKWLGSMINDQVPIAWDEHQMTMWYDQFPGLYDDVYMDLTFVSVFEEHGIDAPDSLHAMAFATADYMLWHANQAARYNILQGIMPPASGHYLNNPHADDIDFQIESDFAGLMSPGMINASSELCDRIGHIMNYGDGWYGGVFVAGMYTQAFISDDIQFVVSEALKALPQESRFYQLISDVIRWHKEYPNDWKRNWFEIQRKWSFEKGCPDGVFKAFNIDASLNAAYIVLGLLYGDGDYGKTVDISTRAGQDSDCNPSNAAGILGTMIGFSNIPDYWKQGLDRVEDRNFSYTDLALTDVYQLGYKHALQMIERGGGEVTNDSVVIAYQAVQPVRLEQSFDGLYPRERVEHQWPLAEKQITHAEKSYRIDFKGAGIVLTGYAQRTNGALPERDLKVNVLLNGEPIDVLNLPTEVASRKTDVYWNYELPEGDLQLELVAADLPEGYRVAITSALIYDQEK